MLRFDRIRPYPTPVLRAKQRAQPYDPSRFARPSLKPALRATFTRKREKASAAWKA
jgi:hypothetical protein